MGPTNLLTLLPIEIAVGIFRNFFNFNEKVKILPDDYFWKFLRDPYAWREKPKVSLKTLKGASESYLNAINSGIYAGQIHNTNFIFKVIQDAKRGVVTIEKYMHVKNLPIANCQLPKKKTYFLRTSDTTELFSIFKSDLQSFRYDVYTDKLGLNLLAINTKELEKFELNKLTHINNTNRFFYRKNRYCVHIQGLGAYSNITSFTQADYNSNVELVLLVLHINFTSCKKIIKTKNFLAFKMIPWKKKFKCIQKSKFNYMSSKNLVKVITTRK